MTRKLFKRDDFVPLASIIAFVFIGVFFLIGLIGRCLALNQSTISNAQSLDLIIYREAPRLNPVQRANRPLPDLQNDPNDNREHQISIDDTITPAPIQRVPKNL